MPDNAPEPRGNGFIVHAKVDADLASLELDFLYG